MFLARTDRRPLGCHDNDARAALFRVLFTLNQNSIASHLILGTEVGQTRRILGLLLCGIASLH